MRDQQLKNVQQIQATPAAFVAILADYPDPQEDLQRRSPETLDYQRVLCMNPLPGTTFRILPGVWVGFLEALAKRQGPMQLRVSPARSFN